MKAAEARELSRKSCKVTEEINNIELLIIEASKKGDTEVVLDKAPCDYAVKYFELNNFTVTLTMSETNYLIRW